MEREYRIDPELNKVLPELSEDDYKELENSLIKDGYKGAPIMVWGDIIVDGHNRYEICQKHSISFDVKEVEFSSKEDAIQWMVRQQLGRRNLTTLQRIAIVEKYRPIYERKAKENKSKSGGDRKSVLKNSSKPISPKDKIDVRAECAKDANTSTDTYSKGVKILNSNNTELIEDINSGRKSINKAYNELNEKNGSTSCKEKLCNEQEPGTCKPKDVQVQQRNSEDPVVEPDKNNSNITPIGNEGDISELKAHYDDFVSDMKWLTTKSLIKEDEEVAEKIYSDLRTCVDKLENIKGTIEDIGNKRIITL